LNCYFFLNVESKVKVVKRTSENFLQIVKGFAKWISFAITDIEKGKFHLQRKYWVEHIFFENAKNVLINFQTTKKFSEIDIINMLEFLIDNTFVMFGGLSSQEKRKEANPIL
jgi:hypothetical protein